MRHIRLLTPHFLFPDARLSLTANPAHYLSHVLRVKVGASIRLFNGESGEWEAEVLKIHKKSVDVRVHHRTRIPEKGGTQLVLLFAPLKPHRLEMLIEKGTEIGVTHFIPCQTRYTNIRQLNLKRWEAIATEATEQCGRLSPPLLSSPTSLESCLHEWPQEAPLFCGDIESPSPFLSQLTLLSQRPLPSQLGFLVGPEGGWSEEEKRILRGMPFISPVSLSPTVLRAETAALLGVGLLALTLSPHVNTRP